MTKKILKDVKKHHLHLLLQSLFSRDSATMSELSNDTQLSQPSVRNMIRLLQQHDIVKETGNDHSTGGRCPTRFALVEKHFNIICLYIQNPKITYQIHSYKKILTTDILEFEDEQQLITLIKVLLTKFNCQCIVIAVEGIVRNNEYLTDHNNHFETHTWITELEKSINIPILVENDVKAMQLGTCYHHHKNSSIYLHLNKKGIGSSYMYNGQLVHGKYGIAGEIGLIPYHDISLNQAVRTCNKPKDFQNIIAYLLIIVLTSLDPEHVDLSLELDWDLDWHLINETIYTYLHSQFIYDIKVYKQYLDNLFHGLNYLGIEKILKQLVEESNEKI